MNFVKHLKRHLLAAMLLASSLSAHADDLLARVKTQGELAVGTEMQFAPFDFIQNGGQAGFNKDLFAEVGKILGVKVRFIDLPWDSVLPGLDAGKFDMVAGPLTVTKARMDRYAFTLPIADATDALLKRANDSSINKSADIAGKVVGAQKSSAQNEQLKAYIATLKPATTVRDYVDNNQAYADLASGRLNAVANSLTNIAYVAKQRPNVFAVVQPAFGSKVYFAYCMRKDADSESLDKAFNDALLTLNKNGQLASLQKKWFGVAVDLPTAMPAPAY